MPNSITKRMKRALTYAVAGTTIAWSVGLAGLPIAFGATAGDRIKIKCAAGASVNDPCRSVYYFGADNKRYVFPDEKTYKTWYADFTGVTDIAKTEMESYMIGGNVTARPGVKLLKVTTDPRVYAVSKGGTLWHVASEAVAKAIFGDQWAKMVNDLPDAFFFSYKVVLDTDNVTPKKINAAADYDKTAQMAASATINADKALAAAAPITTTPTIGGGPAASTLSVALASDTPASGIVVQNSIRVPFTTVNFTASTDGDATIDAMVITRGGGAAQDGAFAGLVLWDAVSDKRISNTARTLSSLHEASFNEDIVVKAGTTRKVIIAGNMASSLTNYAGEVPTLGIKSITMKGTTALVGASLPLSGNYQTLNNTVTIGTLTVTTGADNPSNSTQKIGITDFIFTGLRVTAGSAENVEISKITFNQGGTAADADVQNLDLVVEGSVVATVAKAADKNVEFDLRTSPIKLDKGKSKQVNLRGDLVSGSSRTVRWDIKKQDDLIAKGMTFGFSPTPTYNNTTEPYHNQGGTITINRGTVTVTPTAGTLSANIAEDTKDVTLGRFDFDIRGESVSIETVGLQFVLATSTAGAQPDDITNVKLVDKDGKVLGGPKDVANGIYDETTTGADRMGAATITDTFILPPGVNVVTVKADLNADFGSNDTIKVNITPKANITAKGVDTGETLVAADREPTGVQTSATYTLKIATIAMSVDNQPVAQNVVGGTQNFEFARFRLDAADSGEDVKITQMASELITVTAVPADFTNWRVYDGETALQVSNSPDPTGTSAGAATTTFTFVNPLIVTKGTVKTVRILGSISASRTSGTIQVGMATASGGLSATGKASGQTATVTTSVSAGQVMTLQSAGTLTVSGLTTSHPERLLPGNTSGLEIGIFRMTAAREPIRVEKIYLSATSTRNLTAANTKSAFNQIKAIHLYEGATRITPDTGIQPTTTASSGIVTVLVDITSNPIVVSTVGQKDILVKVDTNPVTRYPQASTGDPGQGFTLSIAGASDITAKGAQSGTTLASANKTLSSAALLAQSVMSTVPIVTVYANLATSEKISQSETLPKLRAGAQKELYRFKVGADSAGDVYLSAISLVINEQKATVTSPFIALVSTGQQVAATTTAPIQGVTAGDQRERNYVFQFTSDGLVPSNLTFAPYRVALGSSQLFTLKGDIACWADNGCGATNPTGVLSIGFLGDGAFPSTYPDSAQTLYASTGSNSNRFIWSDASIMGALGIASTTATTSEQWFNGFRVRSAVSPIGRLQATTTDVQFNP